MDKETKDQLFCLIPPLVLLGQVGTGGTKLIVSDLSLKTLRAFTKKYEVEDLFSSSSSDCTCQPLSPGFLSTSQQVVQ